MTALERLWARLSGSHAATAHDGQNGDEGELKPREMTGLYAQLTPEQRKLLCSYTGPINSGEGEASRFTHPNRS